MHKVVLTLDRVPGQRPMKGIMKIPRPSQLDDWHLYEKYEAEMVKQNRGDERFLNWKLAKAQQKIEQDQWIRTVNFDRHDEVDEMNSL